MVTLVVSPSGLYAAPISLLRLVMQPFLIPWGAVTRVEDRRFLQYRRGAFFLRGSGVADLVVPGTVLDATRAFLACEVVRFDWIPVRRFARWLEETRREVDSW